jgi:hypothetical protein
MAFLDYLEASTEDVLFVVLCCSLQLLRRIDASAGFHDGSCCFLVCVHPSRNR